LYMNPPHHALVLCIGISIQHRCCQRSGVAQSKNLGASPPQIRQAVTSTDIT
jgi:hypothetical protein